MKLHLITVGKPKLEYAKLGWHEYVSRLSKQHTLQLTHLADKYADDAAKLLETAGGAYKVALVIGAPELSSHELATFLRQKELESSEVAWLIGGPNGLPKELIDRADLQFGFSKLTFPHDLAMLMLSEALYRASTINAGSPYHH